MIKSRNNTGSLNASLTKALLSFAFFGLLCFSLNANEADDLKKLGELLSKARSFSVDIKIKTYKKAGDEKPASTSEASLRKKDELYYSSAMGQININNKHCALSIDKNSKTILCSPPSPASKINEEQIKQQFVFYDTLLKKQYNLKYIVNNDKQKIIGITMNNNKSYKKILVHLQPQSNYLLKVEYEYNVAEGSNAAYEKVEIDYNNFTINGNIDNEVFSEKKYISLSGRDKVSLSPAYAAYTLQNKLTDSKK